MKIADNLAHTYWFPKSEIAFSWPYSTIFPPLFSSPVDRNKNTSVLSTSLIKVFMKSGSTSFLCNMKYFGFGSVHFNFCASRIASSLRTLWRFLLSTFTFFWSLSTNSACCEGLLLKEHSWNTRGGVGKVTSSQHLNIFVMIL